MTELTETNYEVNDVNLLSQSADDFLDKPNTESVAPKVKAVDGEHTVCVLVDFLNSDESSLKSMMRGLTKMCVPNHKVTDTHTVALLVIFQGPNRLQRLGYCDVLTASSCILRLVMSSGVQAKVYREYGTEDEYLLGEADLGKRPFKF